MEQRNRKPRSRRYADLLHESCESGVNSAKRTNRRQDATVMRGTDGGREDLIRASTKVCGLKWRDSSRSSASKRPPQAPGGSSPKTFNKLTNGLRKGDCEPWHIGREDTLGRNDENTGNCSDAGCWRKAVRKRHPDRRVAAPKGRVCRSRIIPIVQVGRIRS